MRITRSDSRRLVLVDFPWIIGPIALACAAVGFGVAVVAVAQGRGAGQIIGPLIGGVMFFVAGAAITKRSEFDFDLVAKQLTWRRRGIFTNAGGVVPFAQIRAAAVQSTTDNDGGLTYRVVLHTHDRGTIPLTDSYDGVRQTADGVSSAINDALKLDFDQSRQIESDILELAIAGRKIDAIALARKHYGYDLATARQFVEQLSA
jgi:hypothetical protein